ncbi:hypothetical protein KC19_1G199700 [Ceratodon purpureus]|uniref:Uncharacterized protein n=1 Tax=Ceratodon purpureus TaxID=3225 RepID=A0A8T0JA89_CERPU|nr:hypothetical protein KC19_1G199700 [Ceratodon purpureus]
MVSDPKTSTFNTPAQAQNFHLPSLSFPVCPFLSVSGACLSLSVCLSVCCVSLCMCMCVCSEHEQAENGHGHPHLPPFISSSFARRWPSFSGTRHPGHVPPEGL